MATAFMKWLERRPQNYDRGIQILTFGRLSRLHERILSSYIRERAQVLELGCGTGKLAVQMTMAGAKVTAIDIAPEMLEHARRRAVEAGLEDQIRFQKLDVSGIQDHFPGQSFDLIVASLIFSELPAAARDQVLQSCWQLLKPGGRLLLLDERIPEGFWGKLFYYFLRVPTAILTWLLTGTSTSPLRSVQTLLKRNGFQLESRSSQLGGSLFLYDAKPLVAGVPHRREVIPRLRHKVTVRSLLTDLWALFFRIIPPYPKVNPGLYTIGEPGPDSPILVTGNYDLTVRRLVHATDGQVDGWVLVVDSAGVNVWCGAGGGFLTAEKIIRALRASGLKEHVQHQTLILPQLCANGVDGWEIRDKTGWDVAWGPVRAEDIPDYFRADFRRAESMRLVHFPFKDRLEMVSGTLGFYSLLILLPVGLFWRSLFLPTLMAILGLSYFYAGILPWIPGKDGLAKSPFLAAIGLLGMGAYTLIWDPVAPPELFNRALGISGLAIFVSAEFQGMSPKMRGEQANWIWEAILGVGLGLIYWLVPRFLGWR